MATTTLNSNALNETVTSCQTLAAADVDTGTAGTIAVTFPDLQEVYDAVLQIDGGYLAICTSVALNVATFKIYQSDASLTADAALALVVSGSDLGAGKATGFGIR